MNPLCQESKLPSEDLSCGETVTSSVQDKIKHTTLIDPWLHTDKLANSWMQALRHQLLNNYSINLNYPAAWAEICKFKVSKYIIFAPQAYHGSVQRLTDYLFQQRYTANREWNKSTWTDSWYISRNQRIEHRKSGKRVQWDPQLGLFHFELPEHAAHGCSRGP